MTPPPRHSPSAKTLKKRSPPSKNQSSPDGNSEHHSSSPPDNNSHSNKTVPTLRRSPCVDYRIIGDIFDYTAAAAARPPWTSRYYKAIWNWNILVTVSCLLRVFLNPFFLVLIQIQEGNCFRMDPIAPFLACTQTVLFLIYFAHISLKFAMWAREVQNNQYLQNLKLIGSKITYDVITLIPSFLEIYVYCKLPELPAGGSVWLYFVGIFLYFPRLSKFIQEFYSGRGIESDWHKIIIKSDWVRIVLNLLFFIFAGEVIGSVWYSFSVKRISECIAEVCSNHNITASECMFCHGSKIDPKRELIAADVTCFNQDDEIRYGVFLKAVNLTKHGFFTRSSYSVLWGFQQISTMAGNLVPNYIIGEIFLVIFIIVVGLVSFGLFVNNLQKLLGDYWGRHIMPQEEENESHDTMPEEKFEV